MITQSIEEILEDMEVTWSEWVSENYDYEAFRGVGIDQIQREFYVDWLTEHGFNEDRIEQIMRRY